MLSAVWALRVPDSVPLHWIATFAKEGFLGVECHSSVCGAEGGHGESSVELGRYGMSDLWGISTIHEIDGYREARIMVCVCLFGVDVVKRRCGVLSLLLVDEALCACSCTTNGLKLINVSIHFRGKLVA